MTLYVRTVRTVYVSSSLLYKCTLVRYSTVYCSLYSTVQSAAYCTYYNMYCTVLYCRVTYCTLHCTVRYNVLTVLYTVYVQYSTLLYGASIVSSQSILYTVQYLLRQILYCTLVFYAIANLTQLMIENGVPLYNIAWWQSLYTSI